MSRPHGSDLAGVVVASLALPPPVNGQALINAAVAGALKGARLRIKLVDTSPKAPRKDMRYHARRIAAFGSVLSAIAANAFRSPRRLYTVVEPGHGMIYTLLMTGAARLFGYEIFLHHHAATYAKSRDLRFSLLCLLAGERATHVALCEEMARDLRARYRYFRRWIMLGNAGLIHDPGNPAARDAHAEFTIGFLSNLSIEKGLDTVIRSYAAIRAGGASARLLLAGPIADDHSRALIDRARQMPDHRIVELGPVAGAEKDSFFRAIDLFLFPSRYKHEAQPLVLLEALSYAIPTLATAKGYCADLLTPLDTSTDTETFVARAADFAQSLIRDPMLRTAQRSRARARFVELAEASRREIGDFLTLLARR